MDIKKKRERMMKLTIEGCRATGKSTILISVRDFLATLHEYGVKIKRMDFIDEKIEFTTELERIKYGSNEPPFCSHCGKPTTVKF